MSLVTIDSVWWVEKRRMWSSAPSRSSTTATERSRLMCSVAKSSSVAGSASGKIARARSSACTRDALGAQGGEHRRQQALGGARVDQQRLEGVADARPLHLRVDGDLDGRLLVGALVEEDVHDAGAGLDHRHLRLAHDGVDQLRRCRAGSARRPGRAPASAACAPSRPNSSMVCTASPGSPTLSSASCSSSTSTRLVFSAARAAAQHDGVAALERERGDVDGDVGPRLVDRADDAERHAHLAELEAVRAGSSRGPPRRPGRAAR